MKQKKHLAIVGSTQNIVYFWEKPFGDNPQNPPSLEGKPMKFDLGNLQTQVDRKSTRLNSSH